MKVAYICGPYRSDTVSGIVSNIRKAEYYAKKYWKLGYAVICPHLNTALFDGVCRDDVWLQGDKELVRRSDVIVMIPGWNSSTSSIDKCALAGELNKEVIYEKE